MSEQMPEFAARWKPGMKPLWWVLPGARMKRLRKVEHRLSRMVCRRAGHRWVMGVPGLAGRILCFRCGEHVDA